MGKMIIGIVGSAVLCLGLAACNNNNGTAPAASPPVGINPYGGNPYSMFQAPICPPGSAWSPYGTCVGPNGIPYQIPYQNYPTASGFYTENWNEKSLRITDTNVYNEFVKNAMGVCDRTQYSGGLASCSSWISGFLDVTIISFDTQSNILRATFRAWPRTSPGGWWAGNFPSFNQFVASLFGFPTYYAAGAVRNPLVLDMSISMVNDSQGFEARSYGDQWTTANRSLIQIIVPKGKFQDPGFDYQIAFGNQVTTKGMVFATGHFNHCSTADCGALQMWGQ